MKKNGFTLIELLAVLVILALVALVTITAVSGTLKTHKNNLYNNQIENIKSAARVWASERNNIFLLPNSSVEATCEYNNINNCPNDYNKLIIKLSDLQKGGYIDDDITNPKTKEKFEDLEIVITKKDKKIEYEVIDQNYFIYKVGDEIEVKVNNNDIIKFYVIETSSSNSKYVKAIAKESYNQMAWCNNCTTNVNGYTSIIEFLNNLGWTNVEEKRLITQTEFNNAKATIINDNNKIWLGENYWTATADSTNNLKAYYINSNLQLTSDSILTQHDIRPVIKVSKVYIKSN